MTDGTASGNSSFVKNWVYPGIFIVGVPAVVAFFMWKFGDVPFFLAFAGLLLLFAGVLVYSLGMFHIYETVAGRMGWRCKTGPQPRITGISGSVDIVIEGDFRGRPFSLYRQKPSNSTQGDVEFWTILQWIGDDIRLPAFTLEISSSLDAGMERLVGARAMVDSMTAALGSSKPGSRIELGIDSNLARRAVLMAPDKQAALSFFTPALCDRLDSLISTGSIDSAPGRLVISGQGFPLPWKLKEYLTEGDNLRHVLMG